MDFFKKASSFVEASSASDEPKSDQPAAGKHSTTELFTSAKVVAGAAQSTFANKSEEIDKTKVAGAAGDLLGAAKEYGKLDEKQGLGQYVGQAETYLRSYGAPGEKKDDVVAPPPAVAEEPVTAAPVVAEEKVAAPVAVAVEKVVEEKKEEAEVGDYLKMAGGLSSKLF